MSRSGRSVGARGRLLAVLLALAAQACVALAGEIAFDLSRFDDEGLYGPRDGRRSLDYEYCIPDLPATRAEVAGIDPRARFFPGSLGRIGCGSGEALVLGSTHQPRFREVLAALAALPFVTRIIEAQFE